MRAVRLLSVLLLSAACSGGSSGHTPHQPVDGSVPPDGAAGDGDSQGDGDAHGDGDSHGDGDGHGTMDGGHPHMDASTPDGATPDAGLPDAGPGIHDARLPLRTRSRYIIDQQGKRVKLASVNWYGASDAKLVPGGLEKAKLADIITAIKQLGFNSIRLSFSNKMLHETKLDAASVAANPEFATLTPLQVYDRVVQALSEAGIFTVLNNHTTHEMWCCSLDTDGLWYTSDYSEQQWLDDWAMMAARYRNNQFVIAADLRNEVRINTSLATPSWAGATNDWRAAAERGGARVLEANPDLLVVVEGVNFPRIHLQNVGTDPIRLPLPNRLVYAAHNYGYISPDLNPKSTNTYGSMDWPTFKAQMDKEWGYVIQENKAWTAPVWVSEFGEGTSNEPWFDNITRYLHEGDFDFAYWVLNPGPKADGSDEPYGLLQHDYVTPLDDFRTQAMKMLQQVATGPGIEADWEDDPAHHFDVLLFSDWDTQHAEPNVDWQSNNLKATCGNGARLVGLSTIQRNLIRLGHNALCSDWSLGAGGTRTLLTNNDGDSADAKVHTSGNDWAGGYSKLECPMGQRVVGISQTKTALTVYRIGGLLCEVAADATAGACNTVNVDGNDDRRTDVGGDWDNGGAKGQCALEEYVAGVSLSGGVPHSLLCCAKQ